MIQEALESTGTSTSPTNTQLLVTLELGFISMRVLLDSTDESERNAGAPKVIADNAKAGTGYEGGTAQRFVATEGIGSGFVGILAHNLLNSTAVDDAETAELQCYGYYKDANADVAVAANDRLAPEAGTDDFLTVTTAQDRCAAVALEDDTAGKADVYCFGL